MKKIVIILEIIFVSFYILTLIPFIIVTEGFEYYTAITPIDQQYTAFNITHIDTLFVYLVLFLASAIVVRIKGRKLPPLLLTFCLVFLMIGIGISIAVMAHLSTDPTGEFPGSNRGSSFTIFFYTYPLMSIILAIVLIVRVVRQEVEISENRQYKNKFLNRLNRLVANKPVWWALILLLPVFVLITLLLLLFGQDSDSIVKVFTQTTTWRFSQQTHPPYLDYQGHYLCTVAACGHQKVVKPLRLGKRNGSEIIVNRQLMIANAYEEMISRYTPAFHRFIRRLYDKYGYPLSKHINTPFRSDVIYLIMKPFEYFFLLNLYLFCTEPEKKINKQYL